MTFIWGRYCEQLIRLCNSAQYHVNSSSREVIKPGRNPRWFPLNFDWVYSSRSFHFLLGHVPLLAKSNEGSRRKRDGIETKIEKKKEVNYIYSIRSHHVWRLIPIRRNWIQPLLKFVFLIYRYNFFFFSSYHDCFILDEIGRSVRWGGECLKMKVSVKTANCGDRDQCTNNGICHATSAMVLPTFFLFPISYFLFPMY